MTTALTKATITCLTLLVLAPVYAGSIDFGAPRLSNLGELANSPDFKVIIANPVSGTAGISNGTVNAVHAFEKLQTNADKLYVEKKYTEAFDAYLQLAQLNDKFSQYRVSVMYMFGRGAQQNLAEAYAWSYVSAEGRQKGYVNNHVYIRDLLNAQELHNGKQLVDEYHIQYGSFAIASEARKLIKREKRTCAGSRLGGNCDRVGAFGINCGVTTPSGSLARSCLVFGSIGLPGVPSMLPADIYAMEEQLELMIDHYNPGFVELGDLEIIEE